VRRPEVMKTGAFRSDPNVAEINDKIVVADTAKTDDVWSSIVMADKGFAAAKVVDIDSGDTHGFVFINPQGSGKSLYVKALLVFGGAEGVVRIHHDPTIDSSGTAIPVLGKLVGGNATSVVVFEHGGTYSGYTTEYTETLLPGGSGKWATGAPATRGMAGQILEGHGIYIEVENTSDKTAKYCVRIEWWEE